MKSFAYILSLGVVLLLLAGAGNTLRAERGPQLEGMPLKKTFEDLLNDPSAILDMDEEELTELLPPMEKDKLPSLAEPSPHALPRSLTQTTPPTGTGPSLLASPFTGLMPPPIPTPPPPGMVEAPKPSPEPAKPAEKIHPVMEATFGGLPLVLAPSFFATAPGRTVAGEKQPLPSSTAMPALPGVADVSVILMNNQFYPSRIKLKDGVQTRLIFTTTNKRPAALVMERLQIQRWIAKEDEHKPSSENERIRWEVSRELNATRMTEVLIDPKEGIYSFHDAMSGATGEIAVE